MCFIHCCVLGVWCLTHCNSPSRSNMDTPHLVDSLKGKRVCDVACGSSHSACILDDGSLYTWGKGRYGRLGHNDHEPQYKPKQVGRV